MLQPTFVNRRVVFSLLLAALLVALAGLRSAAHAAPADERAAAVSKLTSDRARLDGERRVLEQRLAQKSAEVTALKKQRASWNRDQKLEARLREAKDLAAALDRKAAEIRGLDSRLGKERGALVREAERELSTSPTSSRKAQLERWRGDAQKQLGGRRPVEIVDADASPLDDPEDLDEKAATLAESERRLRAEEKVLESRAGYYRRQAKLARARQREKEQDVFDDEPRRGQPGGRADEARDTDDGSAAPPEQGEGDAPGDGFNPGTDGPVTTSDLGDPTVVYADVVEPGTLDELARAERSGDPESRAKAADRALRDLRTRADRLKAKRLEMERRARTLRERN